MKKASSDSDIRSGYDFGSMPGGVRGKYFRKYREGTNLVLLDPELAKVFSTDASVNEALGAVLEMTKVVRLPKKIFRNTATPGRQDKRVRRSES